jgi:hypothetical protein
MVEVEETVFYILPYGIEIQPAGISCLPAVVAVVSFKGMVAVFAGNIQFEYGFYNT